jgi:hypothetical protein
MPGAAVDEISNRRVATGNNWADPDGSAQLHDLGSTTIAFGRAGKFTL